MNNMCMRNGAKGNANKTLFNVAFVLLPESIAHICLSADKHERNGEKTKINSILDRICHKQAFKFHEFIKSKLCAIRKSLITKNRAK